MSKSEPQRIFVIGATGLIGSALRARLLAEGYRILAAAHRAKRPAANFDGEQWVDLDMRHMRSVEQWLPLLKGVDAVVNCAGILQDGGGESAQAVHRTGPAALFEACERVGIRRVVHLSAIGVNREQPTAFSRSKLDGDAVLMNRNLDWVILRPSVVLGRAAYGGSALFRGLASLPLLPRVTEAGKLQVVQLDDVISTILFFLQHQAPSRLELELAGPAELSFDELVSAYRMWLGEKPARLIEVPRWMMSAIYRAGDLAGWLGWRPPIRSNARFEIMRGASGDPGPWMRLTKIVPRALVETLRREPCTVQERWFARLYLLKPVIFLVLAAFWAGTALMALGPGWSIGLSLMYEGGIHAPWAAGVVVAGALADLAIGIGIAFRRTARPALWAGIIISLVYAVIGSWMVPRLWVDPLGPMLKIWPVLLLNVVALAIIDDR